MDVLKVVINLVMVVGETATGAIVRGLLGITYICTRGLTYALLAHKHSIEYRKHLPRDTQEKPYG